MTVEEVIARAIVEFKGWGSDLPSCRFENGKLVYKKSWEFDGLPETRAILSALKAAGMVVVPGEDIHIYESALKQIIENSTSPLTVACARYAINTVERGRRAATSPGVPLAADPARRD